jgi:hypothetical protein
MLAANPNKKFSMMCSEYIIHVALGMGADARRGYLHCSSLHFEDNIFRILRRHKYRYQQQYMSEQIHEPTL